MTQKYISPLACGLWWNDYFHHDLRGSHKNAPKYSTATPSSRLHTKICLCVGLGWVHPLKNSNWFQFVACVQSRRVWIAPVWLQLDNGQPSFLKRLLSVCLAAAQSFFFISSTKPSFPTELTAAINWLVSAVSDCVTLSSRGCYPVT